MDIRDKIIFEVCGCLVQQANMRLFTFVPMTQRYCIVAASAAVGFCLGGIFTSFFGEAIQGALICSFLAALVGSVSCEIFGHEEKYAHEVIKNGLTSEQKLLFLDKVRVFFEGKPIFDTSTSLEELSKEKHQEAAIRETVANFFRNEIKFVAYYDNVR